MWLYCLSQMSIMTWTHFQLRYIVGTDVDEIVPALRRHLEADGIDRVRIEPPPPTTAAGYKASRTGPDDPWVEWVKGSITQTTNIPRNIILQTDGSIYNDLLTDRLGMPAIWIPHSYTECSHHVPNEHIQTPVSRNALGIMAGLYWDLAENTTPRIA
jgi:hypothetical protein